MRCGGDGRGTGGRGAGAPVSEAVVGVALVVLGEGVVLHIKVVVLRRKGASVGEREVRALSCRGRNSMQVLQCRQVLYCPISTG